MKMVGLPRAMSFAQGLLLLAFWFGVALLLMGSAMTFAPGHGEHWWFVLTACLLAAGIATRSSIRRFSAVLLTVLAVYIAVDAYFRDVSYRVALGSPSHRNVMNLVR